MILKQKWQFDTDIRLSITCYHLLMPPLIKEPPKRPLPDSEENLTWYGEFWIRYPLNETLYPMDYRYTFRARCEFSVILNRVSLKFFDNKVEKATKPSRKTVTEFIADFTTWYYSLPDPLTPKKIVFQSQICVQ